MLYFLATASFRSRRAASREESLGRHGGSPTPPARACTILHTSLASASASASVAASAYTLTTSSVPLRTRFGCEGWSIDFRSV